MANLRRELLPVLLLAIASLAGLLWLAKMPPHAHALGAPRPRRTFTERTPVRRPPTPWHRPRTAPAPAVAAVTPSVAAAPRAATPPVRASEEATEGHGELTFFSLDGEWYDDWETDFHAWYWRHQRWSYYARREWRARLEALRARRARAVRTFLLAGTADAPSASVDGPCEVVPGACQGPSAGSPRRAAAPGAPSAVLRRTRTRLGLDNNEVLVSVDPSRLCAVLLDAPGEPTRSVTFALPEEPTGCAVTPWVAPDTGDPALRITWTGRGYTQDAVVSLAPGARAPEATVSLAEDVDGARHTVLVNLTDAPRVWTVGAREVTVAPGEALAR
ncbi:MAG: hypothetical protein HY909_07645 [Deltaproteobacteria bacterium]|nr:hypothetical protein [Deltaproteobacteria bacterium]